MLVSESNFNSFINCLKNEDYMIEYNKHIDDGTIADVSKKYKLGGYKGSITVSSFHKMYENGIGRYNTYAEYKDGESRMKSNAHSQYRGYVIQGYCLLQKMLLHLHDNTINSILRYSLESDEDIGFLSIDNILVAIQLKYNNESTKYALNVNEFVYKHLGEHIRLIGLYDLKLEYRCLGAQVTDKNRFTKENFRNFILNKLNSNEFDEIKMKLCLDKFYDIKNFEKSKKAQFILELNNSVENTFFDEYNNRLLSDNSGSSANIYSSINDLSTNLIIKNCTNLTTEGISLLSFLLKYKLYEIINMSVEHNTNFDIPVKLINDCFTTVIGNKNNLTSVKENLRGIFSFGFEKIDLDIFSKIRYEYNVALYNNIISRFIKVNIRDLYDIIELFETSERELGIVLFVLNKQTFHLCSNNECGTDVLKCDRCKLLKDQLQKFIMYCISVKYKEFYINTNRKILKTILSESKTSLELISLLTGIDKLLLEDNKIM